MPREKKSKKHSLKWFEKRAKELAELGEQNPKQLISIAQQADAWEQVFALCDSLGMDIRNGSSGLDNVFHFIQSRRN